MIDHSTCDHPRTSSARAKCRRKMNGSTPKDATSKVVKEATYGVGKSRTPANKADECHICSIERIEYSGTDAFTGLPVLVGDNCVWRVKRSPDFKVLP